VDDVRIYARALSPEEVKALYELGSGATTPAGTTAPDTPTSPTSIDALTAFDAAMSKADYPAAKRAAEAAAADPANAKHAEAIKAAAGVAGILIELPAASFRGAKTLVGKEVELKLVKGSMTATVQGATEAGLDVATEFTINRQTRKKRLDLAWGELHEDQKAEFAKLGGLKIEKADAAIVSAYVALALGELDAALEAVSGAGNHPLAARLAKTVRERQMRLAGKVASVGCVVYEPFDYPVNVALDKVQSASAKGFDGPWNEGMQAAQDSMSWGPLPVKGGRGVCAQAGKRWHTSSYRKIAVRALKDAGLLKDGTTLWLSALAPFGDYGFALGSTPFYFPRDDGFFGNRRNLREGGQGIGFSYSRGAIESGGGETIGTGGVKRSTVWIGGRRKLGSCARRASSSDKSRESALVVLKVAWGEGGKPDRVQLFMPNEKLELGAVVSEISADIDQESLDYISYSAPVGAPIDEIRIGGSYAAVIGKEAGELKEPAYGTNLLVNGSAELFPFAEHGWTEATGTWLQLTQAEFHLRNLTPKHGKAFFSPGRSPTGELYQDVPVAEYSEAINAGRQRFEFKGYVWGFHERMRIVVECRNADQQVLDTFDSGDVTGTEWQAISKIIHPPVRTTIVRVRLVCQRRQGKTNNSYYDHLSLVALKSDSTASNKPAPKLTFDLGKGVKMEFVYINPGTFTMGGSATHGKGPWNVDSRPAHEVTITKGYYIGKYEVTQAQYAAVTGTNPSKFKGADRPVDYVSWDEASEFCRVLSARSGRHVRLPTGAEWEHACRAGTSTAWSFGDDGGQLSEYAWASSNSAKQTHPVGQKKPNPWGLYDMHGNVWEWVADWYGPTYYANSPKEDPTGPETGERRVLRGSSYYQGDTTSAGRLAKMPIDRYSEAGFRAAMSLPIP
jgi:formylglycine-generating enzyme required for sulfatase activity